LPKGRFRKNLRPSAILEDYHSRWTDLISRESDATRETEMQIFDAYILEKDYMELKEKGATTLREIETLITTYEDNIVRFNHLIASARPPPYLPAHFLLAPAPMHSNSNHHLSPIFTEATENGQFSMTFSTRCPREPGYDPH
jgi:hypothetical protein